MLQIKILKIHMFRFYQHREFDFFSEEGEITPLVLISGGNGKGKTTIVDAIEWCLTGNIQHLNIPFELRTKGDRKPMHSVGLLKNKLCKQQDETWVEIITFENNIQTIIRRSSVTDELGSNNTNFIIKQNDKILDNNEMQEWIDTKFCSEKKSLEDFFYKYYIFNLQKVEDFRCKNRQKMTEEFEDFTYEHSDVKQVLTNLEQMQDQLKTIIDSLMKQKIPEDQLLQLEAEFQNVKKDSHIPEYTLKKSYTKERLDIDNLNSEEQSEQLSLLVSGSYSTVSELLNGYEILTQKIKLIHEYNTNRDDINLAIEKKAYIPDTMNNLENQRNNVQDMLNKLNENNLEQAGRLASKLKLKGFTEEGWISSWNNYCTLNSKWRNTENDFEDCKKGDELLIAFSRLVGTRVRLDTYRKSNRKCPLCGSQETFASEKIGDIALEAEKYVKAHDAKRLNLEKQLNEEKQNWTNFQNNLLTEMKKAFTEGIHKYNTEIEALQKIIDNTKLFFSYVNLLNMQIEQFVGLVNLKKHEAFLGVSEEMLTLEENRIKSILVFLGYSDFDKLSTEFAKIREMIDLLANDVPEGFEFDEECIRKKIVSLRLRSENQRILNISKDIIEKKKINSEIEEQIKEKSELINLIKSRVITLRKNLNDIKKEEIQGVAPYLFCIFSKLVKHTSLDGFNLQGNNAKTTDTKMSFLDNQKTPILNIMSDGQLGAFMLSYMIGNAFRRKDYGSFHCFFVDDITNSMDDINLVSFIDLIKYQLAESRRKIGSNPAIQQFFFATCDGNLKRLLQYKMDGFEIPVTLIDLDASEVI